MGVQVYYSADHTEDVVHDELGRVREISQSGQLNGLTIHLGGELAGSDVDYMTTFRQHLVDLGATLRLHDGRSLAIKHTGEVLTNFEI